MDKQLKLLFALLFALPCSAQMPIFPGILNPGAAPVGSFSFTQSCSAAPSGVYQIACTMSTGSLTTGNLYEIWADGGWPNAPLFLAQVVAGSQTYSVANGNMQFASGCSTGVNGQTWVPLCSYVLPTQSTGGTSPLEVYWAVPIAGAVTTGTCVAGETMTQATTLATATLFQAYSSIPPFTGYLMVYNVSAGTNNSGIWTGGSSACTYTPTAVPTTVTGHVYIAE